MIEPCLKNRERVTIPNASHGMNRMNTAAFNSARRRVLIDALDGPTAAQLRGRATSEVGQKRKYPGSRGTSALRSTADSSGGNGLSVKCQKQPLLRKGQASSILIFGYRQDA